MPRMFQRRNPRWKRVPKPRQTLGDPTKDPRIKGTFQVGDEVAVKATITLQDVDNVREMYMLRGRRGKVTNIVYGVYVETDIDTVPWIWWPALLQKIKDGDPPERVMSELV